jgi:hypothetical protein
MIVGVKDSIPESRPAEVKSPLCWAGVSAYHDIFETER